MVALVLAVALLTPSVVARSASGRSGDPFAEFASHVAGAVRWASSGLASVAEAVVERPVVFLRGHHQLRKRLPAGGAAAGLSVVASARRASAAAGSGTDSGIDPAAVTTLAGNGTNQTVDGTGAAASFRDMGGVVYVGGYAYVATNGSIRKVDVISGAVTTLAGDPSATGCTDSASPSAVRFKQIVDIATDGTSLYATHLDCAAGTNFVIRKVAVATGATSTLSTIAHTGYVTYTGGYLFVSGTSTLKINVAVTPDTVSTIANLGANVRGIVGDGTYLWISTGNSSGSALKRVALSDGTVTTVASTSDGTMGTNAIEATGGALYLAINSGSSLWLRRYTESSGTWTTVAGAALGYADGTGTNALFSGMTGIGSDGNALYIADSGNHRLRKAVPTVSMTDPAIDLGAVSTAASGLSGLGDVVVLGRYAYFGTSGAVRKMDVASGAVTTVAGNGTSGSCVDSSDPTAVRFDHVKGIATDGMYLYVSGACGFDSGRIRKVSLATGATSTLTSQLSVLNSGALVYAGGYLFAGGRVINKINVAVSPDTNTTFVDLVSPTGYAGITGDGSYLYEAYNDGNAHGHLVRIALADASVLEIPTVGDVSFGAVRAAGSSLYVSTLSSNGDPTVRQYDEADGSYVTVAGAGPGFADGTASDAWFSNNVTGIASDTTALYVADAGAVAGDGRLRKILEGSPLPAAMPATNTKTVSIGPGKVSPFAGNSTQLNVDGTGTAASFSTLDSVVVVDGDAYVTSASAIRKVSLATGAVSPFAGSYSASGWVDSANPSDVRFNRLYEMATDGHYLYVADRPDPGYGRLRRVSLATGATSTVCSCLPGGVGSMAVGPDGVLYVLNGSGGAATIYQLDKPTGTMQVVVVVPTGACTGCAGLGLAIDSNALFVTRYAQGCFQCAPAASELDRVALTAHHTVTVVAYAPSNFAYEVSALVSAGQYLYGFGSGANVNDPHPNTYAVVRIDKQTGALANVAGSYASGYANGAGTAAVLSTYVSLASDGKNLWVGDIGNYRLRKIVVDPGADRPDPARCNCYRRDAGDPIDVATGNFYEDYADVAIPGRSPALSLSRTYASFDAATDGPFGFGWSWSYGMHLTLDAGSPPSSVEVVQENGATDTFNWNGAAYTAPSSVLATLVRNGDGTFTFTRRRTEQFVFDTTGLLTKQIGRNGFAGSPPPSVAAVYTTTLTYAAGRLSTVTDAAGRTLTVSYGPNGKISTVADSTGRHVDYGYDAAGNLSDVTDVGAGTSTTDMTPTISC